ncbi:hypothetical protein IC582_015718 [Cucumis melo]
MSFAAMSSVLLRYLLCYCFSFCDHVFDSIFCVYIVHCFHNISLPFTLVYILVFFSYCIVFIPLVLPHFLLTNFVSSSLHIFLTYYCLFHPFGSKFCGCILLSLPSVYIVWFLYSFQCCLFHLFILYGFGHRDSRVYHSKSMSTSNRAPRHVWTKEEEGTLVECLIDLVSMGGWKSDNGTFRPGYLAQLSHPAAKRLLNTPFPYYEELTYVFGRDRAIDRFAETFVDVGSNEPSGRYDRFDMGDGNEEFPPMYSQGIDLS